MADEVNTHEKIRLGNDIGIRWSLIDEEGSPYIFDGRDVSVEIDIGGKKRYRVKELTHEANTLIFTYWGMDQKYTGVCSLKFIENDGNREMVTFDIPSAFELVAHSWLTGSAPDNERVQLSFVTLTSSLTERIGPMGPAAGFGDIRATIDALVGTPSVEVITSGPDTAKNITFVFSSLKGEPGPDAEITAESIIAALGYTPADENDIPTLKTFAGQSLEGTGDVVKSYDIAGAYLCAPASAYFTAVLMRNNGDLVAFFWNGGTSVERGGAIAFNSYGVTCRKNSDYFGIAPNNASNYKVLVLYSESELTFTLRSSLPDATDRPVTAYYTKPEAGIPKRDLVQAVQNSLSKADSSVQPADLDNYYTKAEVLAQISDAIKGGYMPVATLPTASADTMGKIYLVPSTDPQTQNIKDEFVTIDNGASADPRYTWEQIGSTAISLDGLVRYDESQTLTAAQKTQARANIGAQESLVDGTNIKRFAGQDLLGSGDVVKSVLCDSTKPYLNIDSADLINRSFLICARTEESGSGVSGLAVLTVDGGGQHLTVLSGSWAELYADGSSECWIKFSYNGNVMFAVTPLTKYGTLESDPYIGASASHGNTDLSANIINLYSKPSTGIPASDLAEGVIPETIESAEVSVDSNTGTPSASASVSGGVLSLEFHNLKGEAGNGIQSIEQTTTSQASGGENIITVTMTNGGTATFSVRNGQQGAQGIQGVPGVAKAKYKQVDSLPAASADTMEYIYLTPSGTSGVYNMSYTEQNGSTYTWKDLGTTAVQLSDYATKEEVNQLAQYSSSTTAGSFGKTNKYIAVANGSEQSSSGYKASYLYPLENIDSIVYSIYSGASTVAAVAFYQTTEMSSYISGIGGVNQLYAGTLAKSDIPANAKYVAFSCKTASGTSSFSLIRTTTVRDTLENVNSKLGIKYDTIYSATPTLSSLKTIQCDIHNGQLYRVTIKGTPVASKYVTIATGTENVGYEYVFYSAEPTSEGKTVLFYPLVSAPVFRVYATQSVEVTIEKVIEVQEYLATPLDARNNIESVSNAGNILGLDNSVTFFDKIILNANVNDAGTVISGGSDYYKVAYKAVSKNDIITILSDSTSSTIPSFILWYSSSKPTMGSTGLTKQLAKGTHGTPKHIIAEWVAPADGYLAITYHDASSVYFAIYKKEGFSNTVSTYVPEKILLNLTKQNAIEADIDSESYGESVSILSQSYGTTDYIDIEGAKFISMYMRYSTATFGDTVSCPGSVFYDSSKNPIGVARIFNRSLRTYTVWGTIAVPDAAKYIRVTEYIYSDAHIDVYRKLASDCNDEIEQLKMFVEGADKNVVRQALYVASSPTVKSLGLLHLSDIHGDAEASNRILNYINSLRSSINDVICTGDSVHYYADSSSTYPNASDWWVASDLAKQSLFVLGNHDGATSSGTAYDQKEDSAAWDGKGKAWDFETYFAPFISNVGYVMPTGYDDSSSPNYQACYWHKDYSDQKIRVIGLDCMHRFDGILNPATGEITSAGLKHTTNEQELWLISKLNETLDSSNAAYGYSVIICCHYPLDDFSGNNETWNDSAHRWQYNNNDSGGRVVDYKTGEATNFHWANIETFTAELKFNMRNRIDNGGQSTTSPNYTKGSANNVAEIIAYWMEQGGKFVAWLCGHVHCDFMWYPTTYPNILCVAIDQAGNLRGTGTGNRAVGTSSRACANFYAVDTQNGLFKIIRFGYNMNRLLNSHKYLCYDYINKKVLNEG